MAGEIFIADKATLDLTKSNVDTIKQDTNFIKSQFPISSGIDWSKYTPYNKYIYNSINFTNPGTKDIINISGEGYFYVAVGNISSQARLIIVVDNKTIYDSVGSSGSGATVLLKIGISEINFISQIFSSAGASDKIWSTFKEIPYVNSSGVSASICTINQPIFFKSNLRIYLSSTTTGNMSSNFNFLGGVKA